MDLDRFQKIVKNDFLSHHSLGNLFCFLVIFEIAFPEKTCNILPKKLWKLTIFVIYKKKPLISCLSIVFRPVEFH